MSKEKRNRNVPKTVNVHDAVFAYFSKCCQSVAEKPACAAPKNAKIGTYLGAQPEEREATLGHWRCSTCHKGCKVNRVSKKEVTPTQEKINATI